MWKKCESCGEDGVLYNAEQRCEVCCLCGVVSEGNLVAGYDVSINESVGTLCNEGTVTKFKVSGRGFRRSLHTYVPGSHTTRTGKEGMQCLNRLLTSYSVPNTAYEEAHQMFRECFYKGFRLRESRSLAGAVVVAILRREKRVVTFKEIADLCDASLKTVGKQFKVVSKLLVSKGDLTSRQPTLGESVQHALDLYVSKIPSGEGYDVKKIAKSAEEILDWLDCCTKLQQRPPHLFALSICFIAFKMANVKKFPDLTVVQFNEKFSLVPEQRPFVTSNQRISPKSILEEMCSVVNKSAGPSLAVTSDTICFLMDVVLQLKPLLENKVTPEMRSIEGDTAFEDFQKLRKIQSDVNLQAVYCEIDNVVIPESEIDEYILSEKEIEHRRLTLRDEVQRTQKRLDE